MGSISYETDTGASPQVPFGELISESTLPLLSYFRECLRQGSDVAAETEIFSQIKAGIGKDPRPFDTDNLTDLPEIPDESLLVEADYINLINFGPSGDKKKIDDSPTVTIIGAGASGLCAGYELKKAGFNVTILEASSRIGGRVKTFREPAFAPGLHGEGGAMRIPGNHAIFRKYIADFDLAPFLDFEMENKFIYISGYGRTITYEEFDDKLRNKDKELLDLFPGLREEEKGFTPDDLFSRAVHPVTLDFFEAYKQVAPLPKKGEPFDVTAVRSAYHTITKIYDKYSLRSYLTEKAQWSEDAINLYDLGNAHVVFENGFIESLKDAFLSSNKQGAQAKMQQLANGMDSFTNAFISKKRGDDSLIDNIIFGARAIDITRIPPKQETGIVIPRPPRGAVQVTYETHTGLRRQIKSDYLVLAIPYTSQRSISKSSAFAPKQEMAIRDVRYVEVTKVLLQYKQRWWEDVFKKHGQGTDGGLVSDLPIRYTMFPIVKDNPQMTNSNRGVIMAAYTFEQDATILGSLSPERRIRIAAENLDRIFPEANSLDLLEVGASQVFPADELSGGSAFCYFGPMQKSNFLPTMMETDWDDTVFFAGEQASYTHGWIQGAIEASLRCVQQIWKTAVAANVQ